MKKINEKKLQEILDSQITYLGERNASNGWTIKALQIALVTLIWLLFQEGFDSNFSYNNALVFYLLLFSCFEIFENLDFFLKINGEKQPWEFQSLLVPDSQLEYLILILKYVITVVVANFLAPVVGSKFTIPLANICGFKAAELGLL